MDSNPAEEADRPDPAAISGKKISTSSAFGGPPIGGRDAEDRLNDLSGVPAGFPKASKPADDAKLKSILNGEVPK